MKDMTNTAPQNGLDYLMQPDSVAIVGASSDPNRISGRAVRYLLEGNYTGQIYPVNPKRDEIQGLKAYPTLADLPEVPDVALLFVPAAGTEQAVQDCVARGVRAAIVCSAGYAESGIEGQALQDRIVEIAKAGGLRLLGPNCLGIFNSATGFFGTFTQSLDRDKPGPGPVGIVSQSGAYGSHIATLARMRGMGVTYWMTTGNEADIDVAEALEWMAGREDVKVIMAYVEGVRNGARFRAALDLARRNRKPVIMMKVGRSEVGARAASSHTASLAGSDVIYDALFRQYGVYRATTTEEQVDVAYACARGVFPKGDKLGVVTLSGGAGVLISDAAERNALDVAPMPQDAAKILQELLPFATVDNPVDTTAQALNDMSLLSRNMQVMLELGGYDMLLGFFSTLPMTRTLADPLRDAIMDGCKGYGDRIVALEMIGPEDTIRTYEAAGFLVFEDADRAVRALGALAWFARVWSRPTEDAQADLPAGVIAPGALSEHASKSLLRDAGLSLPVETLVVSAEHAAAAMTEAGGPVVMKIASPDILHKTEIGGVIVGVEGAEAAAQAFATLVARAEDKAPGARIEGVIVAQMVPEGIEAIVGVNRDPVFGPAVMFGLGGIHVEVLKDVAFRLAPFGPGEARSMIDEIRGRALLDGVRGTAGADIAALTDLLVRVSQFAAANAETLETLDLNPVRLFPDGLVILDALVVGSDARPSPKRET